ncbi:hypothetical protein LCGC14_0273910 [marine sediment metagenome]|uniref:Phage Gp37/Gp68 family protein n=2 Tax=root TaxID=1 RepID=A0A9C9NIU6_9HYPH|nr:phage Gp37/Gp68 family protein [Aurantimonas coralicida]
MAIDTKIEWADSTFNPWWGCTKISPACDNCYAAATAARWGKDVWGQGVEREKKIGTWNEMRKLNRATAQAIDDAVELHRPQPQMPRVFCASMADVFDAEVAQAWREELWNLIDECGHLVFMLLTKRPGNIRRMLPDRWQEEGIPERVWIGTTVESDDYRWRIDELMRVPAAVRFLSVEPMLGPVNLASHLGLGPLPNGERAEHGGRGIHWVICGGESGRGSRPMELAWARDLRDQCVASDTPFFFKQWGQHDAQGKRVKSKHDAGRSLDGVIWNQLPAGLVRE